MNYSPSQKEDRIGLELFYDPKTNFTSGKIRSGPRSNRVNSRVMKWALKNNVPTNGSSNTRPFGRIVGGQVSAPYAWPWQVGFFGI